MTTPKTGVKQAADANRRKNQVSLSQQGGDAARAATLMRQASLASVATAALLVISKLIAYLFSGSVALLGSFFDSCVDLISSTINLFAVFHSLTPPDREHRWGHGKAEAIAGLVQAVFIMASAAYLMLESYSRLANPRPVTGVGIGVAVIVISILATIFLVRFQRRVIERSGSVAITADQLHYQGDLLMNAAVMLAIILAGGLGWTSVDSFLGLAVSLYLLHAAWEVTRTAIDQLMDREFPEDEREEVKNLVMAHPEVKAIHDLRTRTSGARQFIQLHLELDAALSLVDAHRISDEVELRLMKRFPRAEIIIHQDPVGIEQLSKLEKS